MSKNKGKTDSNQGHITVKLEVIIATNQKFLHLASHISILTSEIAFLCEGNPEVGVLSTKCVG